MFSISERITGLDVIRSNQVKFFTEGEFPLGVLENLDGNIILALDQLRVLHGSAISPSPLRGAHIRSDGSPTSRHFIGNGRLSDAIDVFPHQDFQRCFLYAQMLDQVGGIGVYPFTKNGNIKKNFVPMLHIDLRPRGLQGERTFWMRLENGSFINPLTNNAQRTTFFELLAKLN